MPTTFAEAAMGVPFPPISVPSANVQARGGSGMPAYKEMLSDDEKADVIAYLKTL